MPYFCDTVVMQICGIMLNKLTQKICWRLTNHDVSKKELFFFWPWHKALLLSETQYSHHLENIMPTVKHDGGNIKLSILVASMFKALLTYSLTLDVQNPLGLVVVVLYCHHFFKKWDVWISLIIKFKN